jgi:DNA-binding NarL/FixJ family response regulator
VLNVIRRFLSGLAISIQQRPPAPRIVTMQGTSSPVSRTPKFDQILVVDDIPRYAQSALDALRQFYTDFNLTVYLTYTFADALNAFQQYDINLVILDLDLDDFEGDGENLLQEFLSRKPEITVLANSSEQRYNEILLHGGAKAILAKDTDKLSQWLEQNG